MNNLTSADEAITPPGEIMRLVAARMAEAGFEVWLPEHQADRCLVVRWRHTQCLLSVTDWGQAEWEYRPWNDVIPDPQWLASLAAALLIGPAEALPSNDDEHGHECLSPRALTGQGLKARGLDVALDVVTDTECFEVYAEIVVTVPGSAEAAQVRITDEGTVTWMRNYWVEPNSDVVTRDDRRTWTITDPAALAKDITTTLTSAMSQASQPPAGRSLATCTSR